MRIIVSVMMVTCGGDCMMTSGLELVAGIVLIKDSDRLS